MSQVITPATALDYLTAREGFLELAYLLVKNLVKQGPALAGGIKKQQEEEEKQIVERRKLVLLG